ncbi:MAG: hypothetical protein ACD_19C00392G0003 [uncultured bacterium]|nr:MAG: hypothetical protein ACD_19C00392G0003 [uncultured bacterium]
MAKKKAKQPKVLWYVYYNGQFLTCTQAVSEIQACSQVNFKKWGKNQNNRPLLTAYKTKEERGGLKRPKQFNYSPRSGICPRCKYSEDRAGLLCPNCGEADLQPHKEEGEENVLSV